MGPFLIHYHIFKNAGTSIDALLQESFGPRWSSFEGESATDIISSRRLAEFLAARPDLLAVSSHLARPPLPCQSAYPIVFLRHPIERARSVYAFAANDPHQPDHKIAQTNGFRGYIEWALQSRDGGIVIRNYQVVHLSEASFRAPHIYLTEATASDLVTARDLIRSWKLCGIVSRFADSCRLFQRHYGEIFSDLKMTPVHLNASERSRQPDNEELIGALGFPLYERLLEANAFDLALYDFAKKQFESALGTLRE